MTRQLLLVVSAVALGLTVPAGCASQDAVAPDPTGSTVTSTSATTTEPTTTTTPSTATPTTAPTTAPPATVTTVPSTTAQPDSTGASAPTTSTTAPPTPPADDDPTPDPARLQRGDEGALVEAVQERLTDLGYWLGDVDGVFGPDTHHAVVALQKAAGLARDGIVGPATQAALAQGVVPDPASTTGRVIEIDLTRQVLLVVTDGTADVVFDTSTGVREGTTPIGEWEVTREIDGLRRSSLGLLYRPKYFYRGVAIHGYTSVPSVPASHGCVRVTYPAMDALWGLAPIGTPVWVY